MHFGLMGQSQSREEIKGKTGRRIRMEKEMEEMERMEKEEMVRGGGEKEFAGL